VTRHMGDVIRELREQAGMTKADLSRAALVDLASLSRIESHKQYLLAPENLRRVAQALGTTAPELERMAGTNDVPSLPPNWPSLEEWLERDRYLTEAQKDAILRVYQGFGGPRSHRDPQEEQRGRRPP
jgi:transcriptional regulator with XRE-family HTH domain